MKKLIILLALLAAPTLAQSVNPPRQTQTTSTQPVISASFRDRAHRPRVWVDGTEFTDYARTSGNVVYLNPPYNLDYGNHHVRVISNGERVAWTFQIVNPTRRGTHGWNKGPVTYGNQKNKNYNHNKYDSHKKR